MAASLLLSPLLVGDPLRLERDIDSLSASARGGGVRASSTRRASSRSPPARSSSTRRRSGTGPICLRWILLSHAPRLGPERSPTELVLVLAAPVREGGALGARGWPVSWPASAPRRSSSGAAPRPRAPTWWDSWPRSSRRRARRSSRTSTSSPLPRRAHRGLTDAEAARTPANRAGPIGSSACAGARCSSGSSTSSRASSPSCCGSAGDWRFWRACPSWAGRSSPSSSSTAIFSFLQEYRAERAVEALQQLLPHQITVLRDGAERRRPATEIVVPGDVVRLDEGDQVPADGQLLTAQGLRVDQSALTGESHPVFKLPARRQRAGERPAVPSATSWSSRGPAWWPEPGRSVVHGHRHGHRDRRHRASDPVRGRGAEPAPARDGARHARGDHAGRRLRRGLLRPRVAHRHAARCTTASCSPSA